MMEEYFAIFLAVLHTIQVKDQERRNPKNVAENAKNFLYLIKVKSFVLSHVQPSSIIEIGIVPFKAFPLKTSRLLKSSSVT